MKHYFTTLCGSVALLAGACGYGFRTSAAEPQITPAALSGEGASANGGGGDDACEPGDGGRPICFRDLHDPAAMDREWLEHKLRVAAQIRIGYKGLSEIEARHCEGLAERDRAVGPFDHHGDIRGVVELKRQQYVSGSEQPVLIPVGARLLLAPVPGLTKERLQRLVNCHRAIGAALGDQRPETKDEPLALPRVSATVRDVDGALAIDVRSMNPEIALEILRRVRAIGLHAIKPRSKALR